MKNLESNYILIIRTKDQTGLVYKVSSILFNENLNIEKNDEFVDIENGLFFMRTAFKNMNNQPLNTKKLESKLKEVLGEQSDIKLIKEHKKSLVILATKENHCLGDLLLRYENNELNAEIKAVIANRENLKSLVERFNIPFYFIDSNGIESMEDRIEHEHKMIEVIDSFKPDFLALAKFMRILSPNFVNHFKERIINIHHSFLPAFIGANPYKQAFLRGVKIIGATAHFVTDDLDEGPIIAQDIIKIDHTYSWLDMQKAGRNVEKVVFANALDLVLKERVIINNNKTIVF